MVEVLKLIWELNWWVGIEEVKVSVCVCWWVGGRNVLLKVSTAEAVSQECDNRRQWAWQFDRTEGFKLVSYQVSKLTKYY